MAAAPIAKYDDCDLGFIDEPWSSENSENDSPSTADIEKVYNNR